MRPSCRATVMTVTATCFQISKPPSVKAAPGQPVRGSRKKFNSSDDLLIRQQPVTGISLKRLAARLRTTQEAIRYRAN